MSASTERKNRQAAIQNGTDKRTLREKEEAAARAKSKRQWTIGTIVTAVLIVLVLLLYSGVYYTCTTAVQIGDEKFSPATVSYVYATQYQTFYNNYGSYATYFGLDTTDGIAGLDEQECSMLEEGGTWKDYFMEQAIEELTQVVAYTGYAAENNITLDEEEIAEVDEVIETYETYATYYGYSSLDNFLAAQYGQGVSAKVMRAYMLQAQLAGKAVEAYEATLQYTDEELEEYYAGLNGDDDVFSLCYYYVYADTVDSTDDEGETTSAVTEETMAEAKEVADAICEAYTIDHELEDGEEKLNHAITVAMPDSDDTCYSTSTTRGSSLNSTWADWVKDDARQTGDATVVESSSEDSYVVLVFMGRDDNHYNTVSVRHILVNAEADDDGNYTEEALAAAKATAEEIYEEWKSGEATEESFAALAEERSEDSGSNTNGGLYENVYKNEMVEEFNDFCFAEGRKAGDTGIVFGSTSSYEGYHVIYFVGEGQQYSDYLAETAMTSEAETAWSEELTGALEAVEKFGMKFVGKV